MKTKPFLITLVSIIVILLALANFTYMTTDLFWCVLITWVLALTISSKGFIRWTWPRLQNVLALLLYIPNGVSMAFFYWDISYIDYAGYLFLAWIIIFCIGMYIIVFSIHEWVCHHDVRSAKLWIGLSVIALSVGMILICAFNHVELGDIVLSIFMLLSSWGIVSTTSWIKSKNYRSSRRGWQRKTSKYA